MRGLLKAGVCALALSGAGEARAQWTCVNCTNELTELTREAARIQQVVQQIQQARSQVQELQNVYGSLRHLPENALTQLGQELNLPQFRNPLPTATGAIGSLMNGTGMGSLNGLGQQYLNQNRIYASPDQDAAANSMASNANSIAGVQSMADQLYQSAAAHNNALQGLESQLESAPDAKAVADISARVQLEQTYIASQQVQAQAISTWQQAQVRSYEQQRRESRRCYIDAVLTQLQDGNQGGPAADACSQPAINGAAGGIIPAAVGAGGGSVAAGFERFLGQSVGSGQCVALVQAADPNVGLTRTWTQGAQVMGNTELKPGTAIATFDGSGRYANATDGSSHAAIYLGQNAQGIQVQDQWAGQPSQVRTIRWNSGGTASNTGSAFHVVSH